MKYLLTIGFVLFVLTFAQAFRITTTAHRLQTQTGLETPTGQVNCIQYSVEKCPLDACKIYEYGGSERNAPRRLCMFKSV